MDKIIEDAIPKGGHSAGQLELMGMAAHIGGFASTVLMDGEFQPLLVAKVHDTELGEDRQVLAPLFNLFNEELHDQVPTILRGLLKSMQAKSYLLVTEAWTLPQSAMNAIVSQSGDPRKPELDRPISEDDRRISILSMTGGTVAGDFLVAGWKINEGKARGIDLKDPMWMHVGVPDEMNGVGGRLANLLEVPA